MQRNQFTFYRSFWEAAEKLSTNKEKLQFFQILCEFALNHTEPDLSTVKPTVAAVFGMARPILDTAHRRAEKLATGNNVFL